TAPIDASLLVDAPEWVLRAKEYFASISTDARWVHAVEGWLKLERELGFPESSQQRLSPQGRPLQIHQWIQTKRKYSASPPIRQVAQFGASCQLWWSNLQPEQRGITGHDKLNRPSSPLPLDAWEDLRRGGPNGLFLVLLALGWWVDAA
ncbi:hypothetical protein FKP32DRAFT_1550865, partial [Trametes sanguinea]